MDSTAKDSVQLRPNVDRGDSQRRCDLAPAFPEKPIEFTVPFAAGGGSDIMARTIAAMMEKEKILPQPLVVVNRPGASGVLGYMHVGQKTGDPYAITTATNSSSFSRCWAR